VIESLLSALQQTGVQFWLEGDQVRYRAPKGRLSSGDIAEIRLRKHEIARFLASKQAAGSNASIQFRYGMRPDIDRSNGVVLKREQPGIDDKSLMARRNSRQFAREAISLDSVAQLLEGLRSHVVGRGRKYRYASAGGLYPVQVYMCIHDRPQPHRVEGLSCGTYYYDPTSHSLIPLVVGVQPDASIHTMINRPVFNAAAFSIFMIAEMRAIAPTYGSESMRFACIEAGMMAQLLDQAAGECGIGLCHAGGVDIQAYRDKFQLEDSHVLLHSYLGGKRSDRELVEHVTAQYEEKSTD
jgi:SagB-type dehydrogenase family enzyme